MATATASRTGTSGTTAGGWAAGLALFAGALMVLIGVFQFFEGLAAVLKDQYYVIGPGYAYKIDVTAWGWIHLVWGAIVFATGLGVLAVRAWARVLGIAVLVISAFIQFLYIPYYPIWAVLIIGLATASIWALATYAREPERY